jgi:hypothetical protein
MLDDSYVFKLTHVYNTEHVALNQVLKYLL